MYILLSYIKITIFPISYNVVHVRITQVVKLDALAQNNYTALNPR